jgi:hypothetical protein
VASALLPSLITENPDAVILIGFEDREGDSLPALEALTTALHSHSMPIHDRLVVRDGRWRSLDCRNSNCCPEEGSPVPEPADVSGVVAEFVGQGVSPHPDRESLARQVEPGPKAAAVASLIRSKQKAGARRFLVPNCSPHGPESWIRMDQSSLLRMRPWLRLASWTSRSGTPWWRGCARARCLWTCSVRTACPCFQGSKGAGGWLIPTRRQEALIAGYPTA